MSALPVDRSEQHDHDRLDGGHDDTSGGAGGADEAAVAGSPVVVRRRAGVAALVGYAASAVAIAYLWRASQTMTVLDWALCGVMAVIAAVYLASLVDARTPLLVADDLGVRIRLGNEWRGLPWEAIGQVVVHPRRGLLRDGRLVFTPRSLARALDGLDVRARRHVALNQKMYGAPLAVPLGTTTRVAGARSAKVVGSAPEAAATEGAASAASSREGAVADDLVALARGRADVVVLDPETLEVVDGHAEVAGSPATRTSSAEAESPEPEPEPEFKNRTGAEADAAGTEPQVAEVPDRTTRPATGPRSELQQVVFPSAGAEVSWRTAGMSPAQPPEETASPAQESPDQEENPRTGRGVRRSILGGIGTIVSRVAKGRAHDLDAGDALPGPAQPVDVQPVGGEPTDRSSESNDLASDEAPETATLPSATAALRDTRPGLRAEATLDAAPTAGNAALARAADEDGERTTLLEGRELRRPGSVDLVFERVEVEDRVRPISTLGDPVEPLVIDDFVTEPAYDPVIGPELTAARNRLGLSVDELAERTRIRPHVIESIEVDDFAPCGGDFYARGHLRTLARILGKPPEPLLEKFEERYATAPINARRVFEAELATGMTGSMRSTMGGPSWGLLVGVVLCLVLVWGVLRLFTTEPADLPARVVNGSAGVTGETSHPSPGPRTAS